jgi:DNA-binding NarL/FixJ family response regulator
MSPTPRKEEPMQIQQRTPAPKAAHAARRRLRILTVDDHPAVRAGLQQVLAAEPDLGPIACAASAAEGLAHAGERSPDVAVVDYHLPGRDGLSLARQLKALDRPPAVLIYSAYADARLAIAAIVAGADGVASKGERADELCLAIRRVASGKRALPPIPPGMLTAAGARLDPEDVPILGMLVHDTPAGEIADVLGISEDWLDARRWGMLRRLTEAGGCTRSSKRRASPATGSSADPRPASGRIQVSRARSR